MSNDSQKKPVNEGLTSRQTNHDNQNTYGQTSQQTNEQRGQTSQQMNRPAPPVQPASQPSKTTKK